jgi:adenine deaminase
MRSLAAAFLLLTLGAGAAPEYDVLITGARIVDGAGGPWYTGDIAIRGDAIAAVGHLRGAAASTRMRAAVSARSPRRRTTCGRV